MRVAPSRGRLSLEGAALDVMAKTQVRFKGHGSTYNENKKSCCLLLAVVNPVFAGLDRGVFGTAGVGQRPGLQALRELCRHEFGSPELA